MKRLLVLSMLAGMFAGTAHATTDQVGNTYVRPPVGLANLQTQLSQSNTGQVWMPAVYVMQSRTHTGSWFPTLGLPAGWLHVEIDNSAGKSGTIIISSSYTITGQPDNKNHGQTVQTIIVTGDYPIAGLGAYTKIRYDATNGATCTVGAIFSQTPHAMYFLDTAGNPVTDTLSPTGAAGGTPTWPISIRVLTYTCSGCPFMDLGAPPPGWALPTTWSPTGSYSPGAPGWPISMRMLTYSCTGCPFMDLGAAPAGWALNTSWSPTGAQFAGHPGWSIGVQPGVGTNGAAIPFSNSNTGEMSWGILMSATTTDTVMDTHGLALLTFSCTTAGATGVTIFVDCSNNTTAPPTYDAGAASGWNLAAIYVFGPSFNVSAANGSTGALGTILRGKWRWIRIRQETATNVTCCVFINGSNN